jgi:hypothetical protein
VHSGTMPQHAEKIKFSPPRTRIRWTAPFPIWVARVRGKREQAITAMVMKNIGRCSARMSVTCKTLRRRKAKALLRLLRALRDRFGQHR